MTREVVKIALELLRASAQRRLFEMVISEVETRNLEPFLERFCPQDRFFVLPDNKIVMPWNWHVKELDEEMCA